VSYIDRMIAEGWDVEQPSPEFLEATASPNLLTENELLTPMDRLALQGQNIILLTLERFGARPTGENFAFVWRTAYLRVLGEAGKIPTNETSGWELRLDIFRQHVSDLEVWRRERYMPASRRWDALNSEDLSDREFAERIDSSRAEFEPVLSGSLIWTARMGGEDDLPAMQWAQRENNSGGAVPISLQDMPPFIDMMANTGSRGGGEPRHLFNFEDGRWMLDQVQAQRGLDQVIGSADLPEEDDGYTKSLDVELSKEGGKLPEPEAKKDERLDGVEAEIQDVQSAQDALRALRGRAKPGTARARILDLVDLPALLAKEHGQVAEAARALDLDESTIRTARNAILEDLQRGRERP